MMVENWKHIKGFEGVYMVSDWGNVKSINYRRLGYCKNLQPGLTSKGYLSVVLSKSGINRTHLIHRLVAAAFIGESGLIVDHINGDCKDNRLSNLRYCTNTENLTFRNTEKVYKSPIPYVSVDGRRKKTFKVEYPNGVKSRIYLGRFKSIEEAKKAIHDYASRSH